MLYGCRAILAASSEIFDRLLYNGIKENYETQISLHSSEMEVVCIRICSIAHTGSAKEESLTKDNIIEVFTNLLNLSKYKQSVQVENKFITDHQNVAKELEPFG
ncbi:hypothetical protein RhiirA4_463704 [Rhizophagus irregularis]|uniref:BTB domain-containing protein n=1 Tax=Rhizophagus irregularis TaxID=588596 RepID=A0A2I1GNG2_9GLOM|nr:hypothetical protein RhiirA4_463704 [Rhizophagus irregularis]